MRVALGTIEISEEDRKKVGKAVTGRTYWKRDAAREWALGLIEAEIARLSGATTPGDNFVPAPTGPPEAGTLPEPAPATTPA